MRPLRPRKHRGGVPPREKKFQIPVWPIAINWYMQQDRLGIDLEAGWRQASDGRIFLTGKLLGEVEMEATKEQLPDPSASKSLVAGILKNINDSGVSVLMGAGESPEEALDNLLKSLEREFIDEVGEEMVGDITLAALREHPELCDEDYARELLGYATMAEVTIEA